MSNTYITYITSALLGLSHIIHNVSVLVSQKFQRHLISLWLVNSKISVHYVTVLFPKKGKNCCVKAQKPSLDRFTVESYSQNSSITVRVEEKKKHEEVEKVKEEMGRLVS